MCGAAKAGEYPPPRNNMLTHQLNSSSYFGLILIILWSRATSNLHTQWRLTQYLDIFRSAVLVPYWCGWWALIGVQWTRRSLRSSATTNTIIIDCSACCLLPPPQRHHDCEPRAVRLAAPHVLLVPST